MNHLHDLKKIVYFTKPGDRKKYFTINKDSICLSIDTLVESWSSEKELHLEIKTYKESINNSDTIEEDERFELDFHDDYIQFLQEVTKSVLKLRSKITEKNNKFNK